MILHDYSCAAHGFFEAAEPVCPHGCKGGMIQIAHLQAPSIGTARTKNLDKTICGLAAQFGLTDMDNRGGQAVKRPDAMAAKRAEEYSEFMRKKFGNPWQSVAAGGVQQPDGSVKGGSSGGGAIQSIQGLGAQGGNALSRDAAGNVSVPCDGGNYAIPLSKNIQPKHIAGEFKAEIK